MECYVYWLQKKFLFWNFRRRKIRSFFEPKSWWKDDIYWLLKSSCFELFGDGKYGGFFLPKSLWKDDIYLVFLSFPWYYRTWEIWFFVQWTLSNIYDEAFLLFSNMPLVSIVKITEPYNTITDHAFRLKALSLMFERILNTALLKTRIFIPYTGLPFFGSKEKKIKELGKIS